MSTIKETTLHPDNDPNVDLYPRTLATLVEGLDAAITTKAPRPVACKIVLPQGVTKGTLTEEQLTILSASPQNYIEMVNDKELYYLNDPGHKSGFYTYSHVGIENSKATIKTLTITVSAKSFVIVTTVVPTEAGGGKLYRHLTNYNYEDSTHGPVYITVITISSTATRYTANSYGSLVNNFVCGYKYSLGNINYETIIYLDGATAISTYVTNCISSSGGKLQYVGSNLGNFTDIVTEL